jgi:hypothetical protein
MGPAFLGMRNGAGVFRQLMHIDNMSKAAQLEETL